MEKHIDFAEISKRHAEERAYRQRYEDDPAREYRRRKAWKQSGLAKFNYFIGLIGEKSFDLFGMSSLLGNGGRNGFLRVYRVEKTANGLKCRSRRNRQWSISLRPIPSDIVCFLADNTFADYEAGKKINFGKDNCDPGADIFETWEDRADRLKAEVDELTATLETKRNQLKTFEIE